MDFAGNIIEQNVNFLNFYVPIYIHVHAQHLNCPSLDEIYFKPVRMFYSSSFLFLLVNFIVINFRFKDGKLKGKTTWWGKIWSEISYRFAVKILINGWKFVEIYHQKYFPSCCFPFEFSRIFKFYILYDEIPFQTSATILYKFHSFSFSKTTAV